MATGKLKIDIRRQKILDKLNLEGRVSVAELSKDLDTTPVTIRNDLDVLAEEGRLDRIQGGAVTKSRNFTQMPGSGILLREEKQAIARMVLDCVRDGDTLFINSGTTSLLVAQALSKRRLINVVTNSLDVAKCMSPFTSIRVVLLGGNLNADYGFTYGGDAVQQLRKYQPEWAILSVDGVDARGGITTYHAEEAMIDRTMMEQAHHTIIAADHRKIGKIGFSHICNISRAHTLITDSGCDEEALALLKQTGATVTLASAI